MACGYVGADTSTVLIDGRMVVFRYRRRTRGDEELREYRAEFLEAADLVTRGFRGWFGIVGFEEVHRGPASALDVAAVKVGVVWKGWGG